LAHQWLDFYFRTADFNSGEKLASKIADIAAQKQKLRQSAYFQARKAAFLIRQNQYEKAEKILSTLQNQPSLTSLKELHGFISNYVGLACFHRGKFKEAVQYFEHATTVKHPERSSSFMNLGIVFGRLGQLENAKKWLDRAVAVFQKHNDSERLAIVLGNLGILLKQQGKTQEARRCYFRSLQLFKCKL
jgi:tetratricopeptide (TPR) repeat protein